MSNDMYTPWRVEMNFGACGRGFPLRTWCILKLLHGSAKASKHCDKLSLWSLVLLPSKVLVFKNKKMKTTTDCCKECLGFKLSKEGFPRGNWLIKIRGRRPIAKHQSCASVVRITSQYFQTRRASSSQLEHVPYQSYYMHIWIDKDTKIETDSTCRFDPFTQKTICRHDDARSQVKSRKQASHLRT